MFRLKNDEITVLNNLQIFLKKYAKNQNKIMSKCILCFGSFLQLKLEILTLPCSHRYHTKCYNDFMAKTSFKHDYNCPLCYETINQNDSVISIFRGILSIQSLLYPNLYELKYTNEGPYFKWEYPSAGETYSVEYKETKRLENQKKIQKKILENERIKEEELKQKEKEKVIEKMKEERKEKERIEYEKELQKLKDNSQLRIIQLKNDQINNLKKDEIDDYEMIYNLIKEEQRQKISNELLQIEKENIYQNILPNELDKIKNEIISEEEKNLEDKINSLIKNEKDKYDIQLNSELDNLRNIQKKEIDQNKLIYVNQYKQLEYDNSIQLKSFEKQQEEKMYLNLKKISLYLWKEFNISKERFILNKNVNKRKKIDKVIFNQMDSYDTKFDKDNEKYTQFFIKDNDQNLYKNYKLISDEEFFDSKNSNIVGLFRNDFTNFIKKEFNEAKDSITIGGNRLISKGFSLINTLPNKRKISADWSTSYRNNQKNKNKDKEEDSKDNTEFKDDNEKK